MKICLAAKKEETLRFNLLAGTPPPPPPFHSHLPLPPSSLSVCLPLDSISFSVNLSCGDLFAQCSTASLGAPRKQRWSFFLTRSNKGAPHLVFLFGPHGVRSTSRLFSSISHRLKAFTIFRGPVIKCHSFLKWVIKSSIRLQQKADTDDNRTVLGREGDRAPAN